MENLSIDFYPPSPLSSPIPLSSLNRFHFHCQSNTNASSCLPHDNNDDDDVNRSPMLIISPRYKPPAKVYVNNYNGLIHHICTLIYKETYKCPSCDARTLHCMIKGRKRGERKFGAYRQTIITQLRI